MDVLIVIALVGAAVWWLLSGKKEETPVVVEPVDPSETLAGKTKAELIEYAEQFNIEVKKSWTKDKILSTIIQELAKRAEGIRI